MQSRDDIPAVLYGLQHIYSDKEVFRKIFDILEQDCTTERSSETGRPGAFVEHFCSWGVTSQSQYRL